MIHVHVHVHVHVHAHAMSYVNGISSRSASNLVRPPAPHRRLTTSASIAIRRSSTPASQPSVHPSVISPPPVRSHQIRSAKSAVASSAPAPASPLVDSCSPASLHQPSISPSSAIHQSIHRSSISHAPYAPQAHSYHLVSSRLDYISSRLAYICSPCSSAL
jgi:hypothetical protein